MKSKVKFLGKAQISVTTKGWGSVSWICSGSFLVQTPLYGPTCTIKKQKKDKNSLYSFTRHVDKALPTVIIILIWSNALVMSVPQININYIKLNQLLDFSVRENQCTELKTFTVGR